MILKELLFEAPFDEKKTYSKEAMNIFNSYKNVVNRIGAKIEKLKKTIIKDYPEDKGVQQILDNFVKIINDENYARRIANVSKNQSILPPYDFYRIHKGYGELNLYEDLLRDIATLSIEYHEIIKKIKAKTDERDYPGFKSSDITNLFYDYYYGFIEDMIRNFEVYDSSRDPNDTPDSPTERWY